MNGKGDKRRPTDERKFRENFDEINWTKGPSRCTVCGRMVPAAIQSFTPCAGSIPFMSELHKFEL